MRWFLVVALALAGCTDTFGLPIYGEDLAVSVDAGGEGGMPLDLAWSGDGPLPLPASCARLACTPTVNEGDVTLTSGQVSGCHAYQTLTIGSKVTAAHDASGMGFAACAETVLVSGILSADDQGEAAKAGPGAGNLCGSGGGHGGQGGDPGDCGPGATYGDAMNPRELGSGGGGLDPGRGGGAIELEAHTINLIGFVTADGEAGMGASAGGGSGGSILLRADAILGAGQVLARGGLGIGLAGGGGGGGRVAIYGGAGANLTVDVSGGGSMAGGSGSDGTAVQMP